MNKKLLTVAESATYLGISRSLLYSYVLRGEIPSIKIGRARRIPVTALDEFIARELADRLEDFRRKLQGKYDWLSYWQRWRTRYA